MSEMASRLKSIPFSRSNDRGLASWVREYYAGAIDMARLHLSHGKQKGLKKLSQAAITNLKQELLMLSDFLKAEPAEKSSTAERIQQAINGALSQMTMSNKFSGPDVDHLFALLIINHHKAGLQMFRAELDYGTH